MTIQQSKRYGAVPEEKLATIEQQMGEPLPVDYRMFLLTHNGGVPEPGGFTFIIEGQEQEETSVIEYFFSVREGKSINITRGEWEPLEAVWKDYQKEMGEEISVLPIAKDPCGNLICLGYGSYDIKGHVYFFDHELEMLSTVADSFTTFCAMLK